VINYQYGRLHAAGTAVNHYCPLVAAGKTGPQDAGCVRIKQQGGRMGIRFRFGLAAHGAAGLLVCGSLLLAAGAEARAADKSVLMGSHDTSGQYTQLPMLFERNRGQTHEQVRFLARGMGYSLFLTPSEAVFLLRRASPAAGDHSEGQQARAGDRPDAAVIRMSLHAANPSPVLEGGEPRAGLSHYFRGADPSKWQHNVEQYAKVHYRNVYPGVDLVYYGNQQQLEYDFVVEPGHDPDQIAIDFDGVQSMRITEAGELVLKTPVGEVIQHKPVVYQQVDGTRRPVEGRYRVLGGQRVGFEVGRYDESVALVIDPVLAYSTYLGGSGDEHIAAVAVDVQGNVYVTGASASVDFPSSGAFSADGAVDDVFVTKFNPHGNGVIYSAYLGGSGGDAGRGIAVAAQGDVYLTGITSSLDFPTASAARPGLGGGTDGFVARLNPAGNGLVFSTYLGGSLDDNSKALAVDGAGAVYVAGHTNSSDFPVATAFQSSLKGLEDGFVTKLDANGALRYSTYLGGSAFDTLNGIDVSGAGIAYVTGATSSTDLTMVDAVQPALSGGIDVVVAKVGAGGDVLQFSTYFGGSQDDFGEDIALDAFGMAYVGGSTGGPQAANDFPTLAAYQSLPGGGKDGFLIGFDENLGAPLVEFSTYHGGSDEDVIRAVVANEMGAFTVGYTRSVDLPVLRPTQSSNGGSVDAFVGGFVFDGEMLWSSYLGGAGDEYGFAAAGFGYRNLYVAGSTTGSVGPAKGQYRAGPGGDQDAFVVRFGELGFTSQDFNADGIADVLWRNAATGANSIWLSANSATGQAITNVSNRDWEIVGVGWFTDGFFGADDVSDLLWRNKRTGANVIWLSGDHTTQKSIAAVPGQDWQVAGVGDFNGDFESDDILWRNNRTGANVIWLSADNTSPQAVTTVVNLDWRVAGVGDFNGDEMADILWRNRKTGANSIWLSGNSAFQQAISAVPSQDWQVAGVADFLADGRDDILWRNVRTGANVIWLNGNSASGQAMPGASLPWKVAAVGDYSGDGRPDILWRNSDTGAHSIWGSGTPTLPQAMTPVANLSWQIIK
jgi:hypothetical protein